MGYITKDEFILMSVMPATYIGEIETKTPGWINKQIDMASARVDTQLRKRYDVPFSDPAPVMVKEWVARMVEVSCWLKRGVRTTDEQFQEYRARGDTALKELEEAANSEKGLYDLPLSTGGQSAMVTRSWPRAYSEQSPYVWTDDQAEIGRSENSSRGGSKY
jgi:phage gp36-like protein